ncbi:pilin [Synechococcus sp. BS55D]|uniref:pilin n=1 Tax=Synechococcus sp. BS55D TaxID=2055943 RepID=UPI002ED223A1
MKGLAPKVLDPLQDMTPTTSRVQKALINRNEKRHLFAKGFTLAELMIVIVIVGILSAVALPTFLSQTKKAAATEAKQQASNIFKQTHAYILENGSLGTLSLNCSTYAGTLTTIEDGAKFSYACTGTEEAFTITATGDTNNQNTKGVTITLTGNAALGSIDDIKTAGI